MVPTNSQLIQEWRDNYIIIKEPTFFMCVDPFIEELIEKAEEIEKNTNSWLGSQSPHIRS